MSVVFSNNEQKFSAHEVVWAKRELIDAIVREALIGQTEAFVDLIMDGELSTDITRDSVNETLRGVKESAGEFLNDMIGDLQREIEKRLEAALYGASVTGFKYDLAGDVTDIEVNVSVTFEQ